MIPIFLATWSCSWDNSGSLPQEKHLGFNAHACEDDDEEQVSGGGAYLDSCKAALLAANDKYKNSELEDEEEKK